MSKSSKAKKSKNVRELSLVESSATMLAEIISNLVKTSGDKHHKIHVMARLGVSSEADVRQRVHELIDRQIAIKKMKRRVKNNQEKEEDEGEEEENGMFDELLLVKSSTSETSSQADSSCESRRRRVQHELEMAANLGSFFMFLFLLSNLISKFFFIKIKQLFFRFNR